jgi:hypothetical protein
MPEVKDIAALDYTAAAELFPTRSRKGNRPMGYRRFSKAADAIRFAIEELSPELLIASKSMRRDSTVTRFAVYTSMPNTRWCDAPLLPFDERPDLAMMESARNEASAATGEQDGGFEAAYGPCH